MVKIERQVAFSGTKDVAEPLRFDAERLAEYLLARSPSVSSKGDSRTRPIC